jgi:deoxyribonuclease V
VLVAVDVDYRAAEAVTACVGFRAWTDAAPAVELVVRVPGAAAAYQPGAFFRRELPAVLVAIRRLTIPPAIVVVDGYVWLGPGVAGLGARLYDALGRRVAVVGVAKRPFAGAAADARAILRGASLDPLYVTAIGTSPDDAATGVRAMHGAHRLPALLKRADQLARQTR